MVVCDSNLNTCFANEKINEMWRMYNAHESSSGLFNTSYDIDYSLLGIILVGIISITSLGCYFYFENPKKKNKNK